MWHISHTGLYHLDRLFHGWMALHPLQAPPRGFSGGRAAVHSTFGLQGPCYQANELLHGWARWKTVADCPLHLIGALEMESIHMIVNVNHGMVQLKRPPRLPALHSGWHFILFKLLLVAFLVVEQQSTPPLDCRDLATKPTSFYMDGQDGKQLQIVRCTSLEH